MKDILTTPPNPYLYEFKSAESPWMAREKLTGEYAWAIPNEAALQALVAVSPIVEIGAGRGYWAWCLQERGADVVAYDVAPPDVKENNYFRKWFGKPTFTKVLQGGHECALIHSDRTLFLCWPDYESPFAADCLRVFTGTTVAYVGEGYGGCTGDDEFHAMLDADFEDAEEIDIPQWRGVHDRLWIYKRK